METFAIAVPLIAVHAGECVGAAAAGDVGRGGGRDAGGAGGSRVPARGGASHHPGHDHRAFAEPSAD